MIKHVTMIAFAYLASYRLIGWVICCSCYTDIFLILFLRLKRSSVFVMIFLLDNGLEMLPLSFLDFLLVHADCFSDFLHFLFSCLSNCNANDDDAMAMTSTSLI